MELKYRAGIVAGIAVAALTILGFIYYRYPGNKGFTGTEKSVAVLPFADFDSSKKNQYIADGITDAVISELEKIPGLRVTARGSVYGYKAEKKTMAQVGSELHAAAIVHGDIHKVSNKITIQVTLIDVSTGAIIWSETYDRDIKDIFFIQDEVAQLVAEHLHTELNRDAKNKSISRPTQNLEAYDKYLNGRFFYSRRTYESLRTAIGYFEEAISLDSSFSRAYSGLADCYSAQGYISYEPPSTAFKKAEAAASKALNLDSTLAEPHTSLGYVKFYYYWNWREAEKEFLTAIRLDPGYAPVYASYGYYLTAMERFAEAKVAMDKALQLDPLSVQMNTDKGFSLYYKRDYDQAVKSLKAALLINPKAPLAHLWLGRVYQEKKMYDKAISEYQLTLGGFSGWPVAYAATGYAYVISGHRLAAKKMLDTLENMATSKYVTPYGIALMYAALNDKKKTFEWLGKAYDEHSNWLVWLKLDPRWAAVAADKRYLDLVMKVGLGKKPVDSHP